MDIRSFLSKHFNDWIVRDWVKKGRLFPPPSAYKRQVIKGYANKFSIQVFIETGTYRGDTVAAMRQSFDKVISIELDKILYKKACQRFSSCKNTMIVQGDSALSLRQVLVNIDKPCLFWLDGHFSGGITACGVTECPVFAELQAIIDHSVRDHVILIDDARMFVGKNGWPTLDELRKFVSQGFPKHHLEIEDDIIRISYPV